jgi:hypothetical protein
MFSSLLAVALALASLDPEAASPQPSPTPAPLLEYRHVGPTPPPHGLPEIIEMHISTTQFRAGHSISGSVVTSENVGYVEARIQDFDAPLRHDGPGRFSITYHIPWWLPPWMRRNYMLEVIARTVDGAELVRGIPITVR